MKKALPIFHTTVRIAVLITLIITLVIPATDALAETIKPPIVRLTIVNESQFEFSITIYGPEYHFFEVPAKTTLVAIVSRDMYSFTMNACNYTETGTLDMTIQQTIHVPICGGRAFRPGYKPHHIDVADYIKPLRVNLRNKTGAPVGIYIRTLDEHHFLNLDTGEIQSVILLKKEYTYSYLACGELIVGKYTPFVSIPFDITCSK
jgi:hypothetical protein